MSTASCSLVATGLVDLTNFCRDVAHFTKVFGRDPTDVEKANFALRDAESGVKELETQIDAALGQVVVLRLRLERARAAVDAQRLVRDEAALAELAQSFPPLSDFQKNCVSVGLPLTQTDDEEE